MRPLVGAISGFGQVAQLAHAPAFLGRPEFSIDAVADAAPQCRAAAARLFPNARLYASLDALIDAEQALDFIDIATPPAFHGAQAKLALERGLHVLCEKPLTIDPAEFADLAAAAARHNKTLFTVHNWAHAPIWAEAIKRARAGAIGTIHHMEIHALRQKPAPTAQTNWRADPALACGGILVDHGWHALYLLHRLLGAPLLQTTARLVVNEKGSDEEATVFLEFPSSSALLHLTWRAVQRSNWALIRGERGVLELRDDVLIENGRETRFNAKLSAGSAHPEWFAAMLDEFAYEIANPDARHNLREAEFCARTINHVYKTFRGAKACARQTAQL